MTTKKAAKLLIVGLVMLVSQLLLRASALAVSAEFTQNILPINCIFTVVNSGTGELYYVTPAACGVLLSSPNQVQAQSQATSNISQPLTRYHYPAIDPVVASDKPSNLGVPPWSPIATINNASSTSKGSLGGSRVYQRKTVVVVAGASSLILLIVVVVFLF